MFSLKGFNLKHTYTRTSSDSLAAAPSGSGFRRDDEADVLAMIARVLQHFSIKMPAEQDVHFLEDAIQAMPPEMTGTTEAFRHLVTKMTGERLRALRRR